MLRTVSCIAVATAYLIIAGSGFAAGQKQQTAAQKATSQCEAMIKQFKRQNVGHVDRTTLQQVRRKIYYAQQMCKSNPKKGMKTVDSAFEDINVRPRH